ncbi:hypothetical protein LCGC14_0671730 [marine sediment metagenome]|uniref:Uncharacterized protein n=1 Tax=marine sediment metagenome TaxID=412755 RepID=A0A0F9RB25_9ZZZZ
MELEKLKKLHNITCEMLGAILSGKKVLRIIGLDKVEGWSKFLSTISLETEPELWGKKENMDKGEYGYVIIEKDKLLAKIKENRDKHRDIFKKALSGWEGRVVKELQRAVKDALSGKEFRTYFSLPQPVDHTPEYDAIIEQIEWTEDKTIDLDIGKFNQLIRDDWGWIKDFLDNASSYMVKV